eukprot:TRINITY_DN10750_c0_g2_i1.p1 TRINITY_DN10750_c0_g2~~TRINITY_DN10750_c0_g2_i1.p1  ORF type:complete len:191 (-),score=14.62 TRINITY_DN10750_c0_g2_i1:353-841(-)
MYQRMDESLRRTEAKAFFANERTFLHWLNVSVTTGSIAAAMVGVSGHAHKHWGSEYARNAIVTRVFAMLMMLVSIFMAVYASFLFAYRGSLLKFKADMGYESRVLPSITTFVMIVVLGTIFVGALELVRKSDGESRVPYDLSAAHGGPYTPQSQLHTMLDPA